MWFTTASGSVFSSSASAASRAETTLAPLSPWYIGDDDSNHPAATMPPIDAGALLRLQKTLREDAYAWQALTVHARLTPHAGSLAHQLIAVILPDGTLAAAGKDLQTALVQRLCTAFHLRAKVAQRLARDLLVYIHSVNEHARVTLQTSNAAQPVVLRIALKHISSLEYSAVTQTCWFSNGHANVLVAQMACRVAILIEPSGTSTVPALVDFLRFAALPALSRSLFLHNLHMAARLPVDKLCTLWCAVYAALLLHNWPVDEPEWFWRIVHWAAARRAPLMHAFQTFALKHL